MKRKLIMVKYFLAVLSLFIGCSGGDNPTFFDPYYKSNLLSNPSFESGGTGSLQGWRKDGDDDFESLVDDAPPGGGLYSVRLQNNWGSHGVIWTSLPAPFGLHSYRFRVVARTNPDISGFACIGMYIPRNDSLTQMKWMEVRDSVWTEYALFHTLHSAIGDSIVIFVSGAFGQFSSGYTYVDLVNFRQHW